MQDTNTFNLPQPVFSAILDDTDGSCPINTVELVHDMNNMQLHDPNVFTFTSADPTALQLQIFAAQDDQVLSYDSASLTNCELWDLNTKEC